MRNPDSIIGDSAALTHALEHISQLAPIARPVLILGERGTGKELAAERLHFLSPRWEAPLDKVNCAALADNLLESELFGHEAGAFTGASRSHRGRFERADGGTLFLDELGTMSLRLQEKLLRLVEYGEFERLGGQQTIRVDVRIVAATHADLKQLAARAQFREDLLDRLSFDVVHLPALRQRQEDILLLAEHFAIAMCAELGWELFPGFTNAVSQQLIAHHWPGNIRELKSAVERSIYRWGDASVPVAELVLDPFRSPYPQPPQPELPRATDDELEVSTPHSPSRVDSETFSDFMHRVERQQVEEALHENRHNQRRTAEALGLSYDQLRGLVRKHQLQRRRK